MSCKRGNRTPCIGEERLLRGSPAAKHPASRQATQYLSQLGIYVATTGADVLTAPGDSRWPWRRGQRWRKVSVSPKRTDEHKFVGGNRREVRGKSDRNEAACPLHHVTGSPHRASSHPKHRAMLRTSVLRPASQKSEEKRRKISRSPPAHELAVGNNPQSEFSP